VLDLELFLGVPDDSGKIDREMDIIAALLIQNDVSQVLSILLELVKLIIKTHLQLSIISNLLGDLRVHEVGKDSLNLIGALILGSKACMIFKLLIVVIHEVDFHVLNVLSCKAILSI
jgi:hypothetical protein